MKATDWHYANLLKTYIGFCSNKTVITNNLHQAVQNLSFDIVQLTVNLILGKLQSVLLLNTT